MTRHDLAELWSPVGVLFLFFHKAHISATEFVQGVG